MRFTARSYCGFPQSLLGLAEAVGEPVTVTFMWEGREEAARSRFFAVA